MPEGQLAALRRSYAQSCAILGEEDVDTVLVRSSLAVTLRESGLPREAEPLFRQVVASYEAAAARGDVRFALRRGRKSSLSPLEEQTQMLSESRANLAFCLQDLGKFEECLALQRAVISDYTRTGDKRAVMMRAAMATTLLAAKRYEASAEELRLTLPLAEKTFGKDSHEVLNLVACNASLLTKQGMYDEAIAQYRDLVARRIRLSGPTNQETLTTINNLAQMLTERGESSLEDCEEAVRLLRQALAGKEATLGPQHQSTLVTASNLGLLLGRLGFLKESKALLRRCGRGSEAALGSGHLHTKIAERNLDVIQALSRVCARPGCAYVGPTKVCAACTTVRYCSPECQVQCWPEHKAACKLARKVLQEGKSQQS
jgi:tetratricopeptide (TPR) repeat protein